MTATILAPKGAISNQVQRRGLLAGVGLLTAGAVAAAVSPKLPHPPTIEMTPITAAAMRLKHLCALNEHDLTDDENDAVTDEQSELSDMITETTPQTVIDAVVLLMAATAEIGANYLHDDGTLSHERGGIMVRRAVRFLAGQAGVDLADYGGTFFLASEEHEALAFQGTVADAAARLNKVDEATALQRHDDDRNTTKRHLILYRHGLMQQQLTGRA